MIAMKRTTDKTAPTRRRARAPGGWIIAEAMVSVSILGLLLAGFSMTQGRLAGFNRAQWLRHRCVLAAEAQLDSIAATGAPIPPADFERLWPGLKSEITRTPGAGDWAGLTRVSAVAGGRAGDRRARVELVRYVKGADR